MDGLLLLVWHKEQRAAGAGAAGYGVAAATPLTLRNSIIPGKKENQSDPRAKEIALGMDHILLRKSIRSRTPPIDRQRKHQQTQPPLVCETLVGRESGRERKTENLYIKKKLSKSGRL